MTNYIMKKIAGLFLGVLVSVSVFAQGQMQEDKAEAESGRNGFRSPDFMTNIDGRQPIPLSGKWMAIIDPVDFGIGSWAAIWKDKTPTGKTDFYEYSFDGLQLDVPGDFNTQLPELKFFEGTVWYKRIINYESKENTRVFLHFGAANYISNVWLNSELIGAHEGGFTPFQFEITDKIKPGKNTIIVRVNNERRADGIPAKGYDWLNYGGITRDVNIIETPETFIKDYFIQLSKDNYETIEGWIQLDGSANSQTVELSIPEIKLKHSVITDADGYAEFSVKAKKLQLWSPENPKLYNVNLTSGTDRITEEIGFRDIRVAGPDILLNGKPIFLKGICFHEESPVKASRATSIEDAQMLLNWSKELGANFVRLAHYPHSEHTVKLAEKMGLMVWSEIPVYQGINFRDPKMMEKLDFQLKEMLYRDKNRCGIIVWGIANETSKNPARDEALADIARRTREFDDTRLVTAAMNNWRMSPSENVARIDDSLIESLDIIAFNAYVGWSNKWPAEPGTVKWEIPYDKPVVFSEFGAEALYNHHGEADVASSWSKEFQEQLYRDNLKMFEGIPNLRGTCPWTLVDFRSTRRLLPKLQDGWNRKGLLSDKGQKKRAWYVMKEY